MVRVSGAEVGAEESEGGEAGRAGGGGSQGCLEEGGELVGENEGVVAGVVGKLNEGGVGREGGREGGRRGRRGRGFEEKEVVQQMFGTPAGARLLDGRNVGEENAREVRLLVAERLVLAEPGENVQRVRENERMREGGNERRSE